MNENCFTALWTELNKINNPNHRVNYILELSNCGYIFPSVGQKVSFVDVLPEQMADALRVAGFPEWLVDGLIEDYAHYAREEAATVYHTVKEVTGSEAITFEQFINEYKTIFI